MEEIFDGTEMKDPQVWKFQFFPGVIQAKSQLWLKVGGWTPKYFFKHIVT